MGAKINYLFKRVSKPLRAIEYVMALGILWMAAISAFIVGGSDFGGVPTSFGQLVDQYEVVSIVVAIMSVAAIYNLVLLTHPNADARSISHRAVIAFIYTTGFFFISSLTLFSAGPENLLWVNEFTMGLIAAVLYLNLRVNNGSRDW